MTAAHADFLCVLVCIGPVAIVAAADADLGSMKQHRPLRVWAALRTHIAWAPGGMGCEEAVVASLLCVWCNVVSGW